MQNGNRKKKHFFNVFNLEDVTRVLEKAFNFD